MSCNLAMCLIIKLLLAQTNTLAAGGKLNFNGNYSFLDANRNGISDAWEQDYFGSVSTNRTQLTDSDHDGMSDYAEFIAGTDPTNPASRFYFTGETVQSNLVQMQWTVVTNRLYQVNLSTDLRVGCRSRAGCRRQTPRP